MNDEAVSDASTDAPPGWSERHVQEGMKAAEFFEQHARNVEAEDAENQLIAVGVGLVIGLIIVIAVKLRRAK